MMDISILVLDPATAKRLAANTTLLATVKALVQNKNTTNAATCYAGLPSSLKPGATCFSTRIQFFNCNNTK